jgi:Leucine-rich repeat (LRR) protein
MYLSTALSKNKATVKDISIYSYRDGGIKNHQLSDKVYDFTALEKLYISGDFTTLSPRIADLQNLQHLTIQSNILKEFPEEIGLLKNLVSLSITGKELSYLPESLSKLTKLKNLSIWRSPNITKLPESLSSLPKLESISIWWGNTTDLTAFNNGFDALKAFSISESPLNEEAILPIFQLSNLESLSITDSLLTTIPTELLQLKKLDVLTLNNNQLKEIPVFLSQIPALRRLHFEGNQITEFPTFLSTMPSIQQLRWKDNLFGKYDKALLLFPILVTNPYVKVGESSKYRSFIEQVKAQNFSPAALDLFFKVQSSHSLEKGAFKRADFIEVLSFDDKAFKTTLINQLLDYEKELFDLETLNADSALCILGKTTLSKSEIRRILKEKGIIYQTKIDSKTTHLLVGGTGIKDYSLLANLQYTLVSQQTFQHYANAITKPYLLEEEYKGNLEHISSLLLSTDPENQSLGLELLKGGGTPKELFTELFIIFKFSEDKKVAAKAKKLLTANAPTEILEKIKLRINLRIIKEAYKTADKLEELTEGTPLEVWKMAQYAYKYKPEIWAPKIALGLENAPKAIATSFLTNAVQQQINRGVYTIEPSLLPYINLLYQNCSFLKEIKFNRVAENIDGIAALSDLTNLTFYFIEGAEFPNDLHLVPNLESVDFTRTTTKDWSFVLNQLAQVSSLKKLSLWSSMEAGLHPEIAKLKNLEYFSCYNTPLQKESIEILAKLPRLTSLDLSSTSASLDERYLLLKNLETLCFHNATHYNITPKISEFKKLKSLTLKGGASLPDDIPSMPLLEELYIKTDYNAPPVQYKQIKNLTNLKRLTILGRADELKTMLPHFSMLEHLELYYNKIEFDDLVEVLKQLPLLKTFHRYLPAQELASLKKALPHLEIKTS